MSAVAAQSDERIGMDDGGLASVEEWIAARPKYAASLDRWVASTSKLKSRPVRRSEIFSILKMIQGYPDMSLLDDDVATRRRLCAVYIDEIVQQTNYIKDVSIRGDSTHLWNVYQALMREVAEILLIESGRA